MYIIRVFVPSQFSMNKRPQIDLLLDESSVDVKAKKIHTSYSRHHGTPKAMICSFFVANESWQCQTIVLWKRQKLAALVVDLYQTVARK